MVNICYFYNINLWSYIQGANFTLEKFLVDAVKLTKNVDSDKIPILDMVLDFMYAEGFLFSDGSRFGKTVITFEVDMNSSEHISNKEKVILIFGKGLRDCLANTTLTAEKYYSINFTE